MPRISTSCFRSITTVVRSWYLLFTVVHLSMLGEFNPSMANFADFFLSTTSYALIFSFDKLRQQPVANRLTCFRLGNGCSFSVQKKLKSIRRNRLGSFEWLFQCSDAVYFKFF